MNDFTTKSPSDCSGSRMSFERTRKIIKFYDYIECPKCGRTGVLNQHRGCIVHKDNFDYDRNDRGQIITQELLDYCPL